MSGNHITNNAEALTIATALFFCWSLSTFAVRAWVKLRRSERWGWDDSTITAALAFATFHVIAVFWAIHYGYGITSTSLVESSQDRISKALYVSQFFYIISIGLSKISTGLFIAHLTRYLPQAKCAYILTVVCVLWTIASLFVVGFRGQLNEPWQFSDGSKVMFVRWLIIETTGLAVEIVVWALSINIIWTLSMALHKRCIILAIFGCRLLLIPLVTLRLFWLSPAQNLDPTAPALTADLFTEAVLQSAFISASVTCLKPFLKPFTFTHVIGDTTSMARGWRSDRKSKPKGDSYYMLSTAQDTDNDDTVISTVQDDETTGHPNSGTWAFRNTFRPNTFDQEVTISASNQDNSGESHSHPHPQHMSIRKSETWSVRIEEDSFNFGNFGMPTPSPQIKVPEPCHRPV